MKHKGFSYIVKGSVEFTLEEAQTLVNLAKTHYDSTCQAAGCSMEDGERENGFIAQLLMFNMKVNWTFRQFDLVAKILEMRPVRTRNLIADQLNVEINSMLVAISKQHELVSNS